MNKKLDNNLDKDFKCPVETAIDVLTGKWKILIIFLKCARVLSVAFDKAALVGEPAVPCNLQSATAGMNSRLRICSVSTDPGKQR